MLSTQLENDWITMSEAATILRVTPRTIHDWLGRGKLAGVKLPGREQRGRWRIRMSSVRALLEPESVK